MIGFVSKWGHSLALRIPQAFARQLNINENTPVNMEVIDGKLVISHGIALDEMLDSLTDEKRESPDDWGFPVGREEII